VFGTTRSPVTGPLKHRIAQPFGDATRDADARALAAMMRHIKAVDGQQHTVIMIQVENETGFQATPATLALANKAFEGPVPKDLMDYLQQHKDTLIPELRKVGGHRFQNLRDVEECSAKSGRRNEIFMAWNFARYINRVVEGRQSRIPIPMFTNCPQLGFGTAPRRSAEADRAVAPWPTR